MFFSSSFQLPPKLLISVEILWLSLSLNLYLHLGAIIIHVDNRTNPLTSLTLMTLSSTQRQPHTQTCLSPLQRAVILSSFILAQPPTPHSTSNSFLLNLTSGSYGTLDLKFTTVYRLAWISLYRVSQIMYIYFNS